MSILKLSSFIALLALYLFSCNQSTVEKPAPEEEPNKWSLIRTYEGSIGEHPVAAKITSDEGKVSGSYFYNSKGEEIQLSGTIDKAGNVELSEFDYEDHQTGVFKGKMVGENKIEGTWSKPNGKSPLSFTLVSSSINFKDAMVRAEGQRNRRRIADGTMPDATVSFGEDFSGNWVGENKEGMSGYVNIQHLKDDNYQLQMLITNERCASTTGVDAVVKIPDDGKLEYKASYCNQFRLEISDSEVTVNNATCNLNDPCEMTGTYYATGSANPDEQYEY